jgi:hypothetical protein
MVQQERTMQERTMQEMEVPGHGRWLVQSVFSPECALPSDDDFEGRFLVTEDGTAYQVAMDAERLDP